MTWQETTLIVTLVILALVCLRTCYNMGYSDGVTKEKYRRKRKKLLKSGNYIIGPYGIICPTRNEKTI